jgi:hypothetical protein
MFANIGHTLENIVFNIYISAEGSETTSDVIWSTLVRTGLRNGTNGRALLSEREALFQMTKERKKREKTKGGKEVDYSDYCARISWILTVLPSLALARHFNLHLKAGQDQT